MLPVLLSFSSFAQKCDYEFNGKDEFTGKVKKVTKDKIKLGVFVYLERMDETYDLRLEFTYGGALEQGIAKGTEVLFKLKDGTILKLVTLEDHMPSKQVNASQYGTSVTSFVNMKCGISKEELMKMAGSELTIVRLSLGGKEFTLEIPEGKAKNLKQSAVCIIQ